MSRRKKWWFLGYLSVPLMLIAILSSLITQSKHNLFVNILLFIPFIPLFPFVAYCFERHNQPQPIYRRFGGFGLVSVIMYLGCWVCFYNIEWKDSPNIYFLPLVLVTVLFTISLWVTSVILSSKSPTVLSEAIKESPFLNLCLLLTLFLSVTYLLGFAFAFNDMYLRENDSAGIYINPLTTNYVDPENSNVKPETQQKPTKMTNGQHDSHTTDHEVSNEDISRFQPNQFVNETYYTDDNDLSKLDDATNNYFGNDVRPDIYGKIRHLLNTENRQIYNINRVRAIIFASNNYETVNCDTVFLGDYELYNLNCESVFVELFKYISSYIDDSSGIHPTFSVAHKDLLAKIITVALISKEFKHLINLQQITQFLFKTLDRELDAKDIITPSITNLFLARSVIPRLVSFENGSARPLNDEENNNIFNTFLELLLQFEDYNVVDIFVVGHTTNTDTRGAYRSNYELSEARVNSVRIKLLNMIYSKIKDPSNIRWHLLPLSNELIYIRQREVITPDNGERTVEVLIKAYYRENKNLNKTIAYLNETMEYSRGIKKNVKGIEKKVNHIIKSLTSSEDPILNGEDLIIPPGGKSGCEGKKPRCPNLLEYIYFSIYTITTTGYGDIFPVSPFSKFVVSISNLLEIYFIVVFFNVFLAEAAKSYRSGNAKGEKVISTPEGQPSA